MDTQSPEYGTQDTTPASSTSDLVTPPEQSNQPAPSQYGMGAPVPQYPPSYPPLSGAPSPYNTPMPANPYAGPYAGDTPQPGIAGAPIYGQPGYGQIGYGQPSPVSMPFAGYPPAAMPETMTTPPPQTKKRRRGLWIALTIVLVLLLLTGGAGAFAYMQYRAPQDAAAQVCTLVQQQKYADLYANFSSGMQGHITESAFTDAASQLDQLEGSVTQCRPATSASAFSYTLFGSTATMLTTLTRANSGDLQGTIHLANENGSWKVDSLDTTLLGVNLDALQAANNFCDALAKADANTAYGALGSSFHTQVSQVQFSDRLSVHDKIDGPITFCKLASVSRGNSDEATAITLNITRKILPTANGQITLGVEGGTWKVVTVDEGLLGTDLASFYLAKTFCEALTQTDFKAAYSLLASETQNGWQYANFVRFFTLNPGDRYTGCDFILKSYKVTDPSATLDGYIDFIQQGRPVFVKTTFSFFREGETWKVADVQIK